MNIKKQNKKNETVLYQVNAYNGLGEARFALKNALISDMYSDFDKSKSNNVEDFSQLVKVDGNRISYGDNNIYTITIMDTDSEQFQNHIAEFVQDKKFLEVVHAVDSLIGNEPTRA